MGYMTTREALDKFTGTQAAYDAANAAFSTANRAFTEATAAYRARTISDAAYLASRAAFKAALLAWENAEAALIVAQTELEESRALNATQAADPQLELFQGKDK